MAVPWPQVKISILFCLKLFGIISTLVAERLLDHFDDDRVANGVLCGLLLVGVGITAFIKPDYRRQAATKHDADKETILE